MWRTVSLHLEQELLCKRGTAEEAGAGPGGAGQKSRRAERGSQSTALSSWGSRSAQRQSVLSLDPKETVCGGGSRRSRRATIAVLPLRQGWSRPAGV